MNTYEAALILRQTLSDEDVRREKAALEEFVKAEKGAVKKWEEWGRKRMTYPIKREVNGYYLFLQFSGAPELVKIIDKKLTLDKNLLRFLITIV